MVKALSDAELARDLVTLGRFIRIYCDGKHSELPRQPAQLKFCNLDELLGEAPVLCGECSKLLAHAFFKRSSCPLKPKPACKHCPQHCYNAVYRNRIREVMRYSGWRLISRGRLDLLWHFLS